MGGTGEDVVVVIVIKGANGLGLCGGDGCSGGDISVELHGTAAANVGGDQEEAEDEGCETGDGCSRVGEAWSVGSK